MSWWLSSPSTACSAADGDSSWRAGAPCRSRGKTGPPANRDQRAVCRHERCEAGLEAVDDVGVGDAAFAVDVLAREDQRDVGDELGPDHLECRGERGPRPFPAAG